MSVVSYNNNKTVVLHDRSHGVMVVHNNAKNTMELVFANDFYKDESGHDGNNYEYKGLSKPTHDDSGKCPNCGFAWGEIPRTKEHFHRRRSDTYSEYSSSGPKDRGRFSFFRPLSKSFMHNDYFKLLGRLCPPIEDDKDEGYAGTLPEGIFNQGYFDRFFKKVRPYVLGSGAHSLVYKVTHVLNDIKLGTYALKRICIANKQDQLPRVLNEVMILCELSSSGANEHNLIRYNHVWLEMGDIHDQEAFILPSSPSDHSSKDTKVPYVYILQQYCDGGHLEDLVKNLFQSSMNIKEQVEKEKIKRRLKKQNSIVAETTKTDKHWLTEVEIWKFFRDIVVGVQYLHLHGILHRDLKPSNCLLDVKYNRGIEKSLPFQGFEEFGDYTSALPNVLLSDFGEGQFLEKLNYQSLESFLDDLEQSYERKGNTGTVEFNAPELFFPLKSQRFKEKEFNGSKIAYTYGSEIYSLGLILCWLCVGTLPFNDALHDKNDPQAMKKDICEWYIDLTEQQFIEWFQHEARNIDPLLLENPTFLDFAKLSYSMIKGDVDVEQSAKIHNRLLANEILATLEMIKAKRFILNSGALEDPNIDEPQNVSDKALILSSSRDDISSLHLVTDEEASDEIVYNISEIPKSLDHAVSSNAVIDSLKKSVPLISLSFLSALELADYYKQTYNLIPAKIIIISVMILDQRSVKVPLLLGALICALLYTLVTILGSCK